MGNAENSFQNINRYSDQDLMEFKAVIEKKLAKASRDLEFLEEQIQHMTDNASHEPDWVDETSTHSEREMLYTMAIRQRRHIQDLENALVRIRNKSYGICSITGEQIDKRRLLAVPTTSKSLAAKNAINQPTVKKPSPKPKTTKSGAPKIISKVIRKKSPIVQKEDPLLKEDDFEWNEDEDYIEDLDFLDENEESVDDPTEEEEF